MTAGQVLDSRDPQPTVGTIVQDSAGGLLWENDGNYPSAWTADGNDPESWTKVAGNYGPVTVVEWGDGPVNT